MVTRNRIDGNRTLTIFENFQIDTNLPKHKEAKNNVGSSLTISGSNIGTFTGSQPNTFVISGGDNQKEKYPLFSFFKKFYNKTKVVKQPKIDYTEVKRFFESVKGETQKISIESEKIIGDYKNQIRMAEISGQTALVEQLTSNHQNVTYEVILLGNGFDRFVEEKTVIRYYDKLKHKNLLKLVYIKNFVRIIPEDIIKQKLEADKLNIFDNYVVLGFDKDDSMSKMTKKEVEKSKDPILFGVIKGSNRLYFIGEWEDEHCDLTLSEIFEQTCIDNTNQRLNKKTIL